MKHGKFATLKWVKPKFPKKMPLDVAMMAATPAGRALYNAAATIGVPRAGKVTKNARDQAVELLGAAAEVEQALLAQYLYAAYSIDPSGPAAALRDNIVEIAKEEMGHLITVQNLLLALGEDPWFNRENVPLGTKPPSKFSLPLKFEPLTGDSLAKYVTTESMPLEQIDNVDLKKKLKPIFKRAGVGVQHVGMLYAKLIWLFQKDDTPNPRSPELSTQFLPADWHIPDSAFTGFDDPRQVAADEFGRSPVTPSDPNADPIFVIEIRERDHALFALKKIAAQGEGYDPDADSHFSRFLKAYDDFAATFPTGILSVPVHPNTAATKQTNPEAEAGRITHPKALLWGKLFNTRYEFMLLELWLAVFTKRDVIGALARDQLFAAIIREMVVRIGRIAGRFLPALDLKAADNQDRKAGAPFELPADPLPKTENGVKKRMKLLLSDAEALAVQIETLAAPNAPSASETASLKVMRAADKPFIDTLAGA